MISIIFSTNRLDPKFDWFIQSLFNQTSEADRINIEIIFIHHCERTTETPNAEAIKKTLSDYVDSGTNFSLTNYSEPKPNIYQGENRKTTNEYFAPSNARNTGLIISSGEYVVFVDDVCVLMPGWWSAVKEAATQKRIVCGAYQKRFNMVVENGNLISSQETEIGKDRRWDKGNSHAVKIYGGEMFGCSVGMPAEDLIKVNGFDEMCDSIGGEDYHLGLRLNNAGKQVWYDRRMFTIESEELHNQPYLMKREDRVMSKEDYLERLKSYGVRYRHNQNGNWDSSNMIVDLLYGTHQVKSLRNSFDIGECRKTKTFAEPFPDDRHWFDRKLLIEM